MWYYNKRNTMRKGQDFMKVIFSGATAYSREKRTFVKGVDMTAMTVSSLVSAEIDSSNYHILPGFADVHVHFREPGFSYKETIKTGSMAAAHGGYTTVCTMPNLAPTPDSLENLRLQLDIIGRDSVIRTVPFGTITKGENGRELSDIEAMAPFVCGYSDDGRGVDDTALMREAMQRAMALDKIISAHCEDGTQIKDSPEAEWKEIERNIRLADETGVKLHICHISTKESVSLIRDAKKSGVDITCETGPHYMLFSTKDERDDGRFRFNPPLREEDDRLALIEGMVDGTVDMIATDHAPHSAEEKSKGLKSMNGIVGLETAFPVMYTEFVKKGIITLERLTHMMGVAPYERFGLEPNGFTVWNLNSEYVIDTADFKSMGRCTPFDGRCVNGKCIATVMDGEIVYIDSQTK